MHDESQDTDGPSADDGATIASTIVGFLRERVDAAGAAGVVVPMSGGLDSTVTATLAVEALGSERVLGLGLPCYKTDTAAMMEAETVADHLGIGFQRAQLRPLLQRFEAHVAPALAPGDPKGPTPTRDRALANVIARLRMTCAYYAANRHNSLVVGTANRSELLLGYVTKYGDGAADMFPLGECYRTEVRLLAKHLGLPDPILEKEPTTGIHPYRTITEELGASYDRIDALLYRVIEDGDPVDAAADTVGLERSTAQRLVSMCVETAHKRQLPPIADVSQRRRQPSVTDGE